MDKCKFGEFIYQKRKELNLTQEELGYKLKVTNKAVSKWETGETLPDIQLLEELAKVLNITIDELITQNKPVVEKEIIIEKKRNLVFPILSIILLIYSFATIPVMIRSVTSHQDKTDLTINNIDQYYSFVPLFRFEKSDSSFKVVSKIESKFPDKYEFIDARITFLFSVDYYYLDNNVQSIISFINRYAEVDLNQTSNYFSIDLVPNDSSILTQSMISIELNYKIKEVVGSINKI